MLKFLLKTLDFLANTFTSGFASGLIYLFWVIYLTVEANFFAGVIFAIPITFILTLAFGYPVVLLNELVKWLFPSVPHATPPATSMPPRRRLP